MEKRISKKIDTHQVEFKNAIREWIKTNNVKIIGYNDDENEDNTDEQETTIDKTSNFLQFVYDYNGVSLTKEDFQKRKRTKNVVPCYERCMAKRSNGEQCTRRKKEGDTYCGTHMKGTPHGVITEEEKKEEQKDEHGIYLTTKKVDVWVQEIKGIHYYIDQENNVYHPDDILSNKQYPRKIGKWTFNETDGYHIPSLSV
jgi:hypothetical protein